MPQFDIEGARAAGYTDDEILAHLTQTRKFDVQGARQSGYSNQEIIDHLAQAPAPPTTPAQPVQTSLAQGFLSEAKRNIGALGSALMNTGGGVPNLQKLEVPGMLIGSQIGGAAAQAATTLPALMKASPVAETAIAARNLGTTAKEFFFNAPRNPVKAMTQALKPMSTNLGFKQALDRALPEIKAVEPSLQKPIASVEDLQAGIKLAKKNIWSQYEKILGPQAQRGIDGSPIADAIEKSISAKVKLQNPQAAAKLMELADTYRRSFTIAELDDFLSTSNAELSAYYGKYPAARTAAQTANPEIAQNVAEANALRNTIYKALDSPGGGEAARELKRRYGALMNVEKETQRRLNVAARQNPESLSEQLSRWGAAMKIGKAAVTFPARPIGALGDLASAYAGSKVASALKEANSADALIANVFKHYSISPKPISFTPIVPRALLGEGARPMPAAPDTSFVKGMPADLAKKTLALPERAGGPFVTPPPRESMREMLKRTGKKRY